jgi:hypothetical protein
MVHHSILIALLWVIVLAIPGVGLWFLGRGQRRRKPPV